MITNEKRPNSTVRIGKGFLDLFFVPEREVLRPSNPERAVSLAHAMTVRDTSLILSASLASNAALLSSLAQRSSSKKLASALASLGRAEDALARDLTVDSDYWLLSAAYDCAYSWLYSSEVSPSPSHLLDQLKKERRGTRGTFESFSKGACLENSSRGSCTSRLDGLAMLYDVLGGHEGAEQASQVWSATRLECIREKAKELSLRVEHAECYSYLGIEMLNALRQLTTREGSASITSKGPTALSSEQNRLLSDRLLRDMGLVRERDLLKETIELVRAQVLKLARKTQSD